MGQLQGTIDLIGGDMVEAFALITSGKGLPIFLGRLEQSERAHYVGAGEGERVSNRTVHVALGCQMDDSEHIILRHQFLYSFVIANIYLYKEVVFLVLHVLEIG